MFRTGFIVQADDEGHAVITTIGDRCFPLINYDIGDVIDAGHDQSESRLELPGIRGREADVVHMWTRAGGTREVIGRFLVHVMKSYPAELAVQIRQGEAGKKRSICPLMPPSTPQLPGTTYCTRSWVNTRTSRLIP